MVNMLDYSVELEQNILPYDPQELLQWRSGDPNIVPLQYLSRRGPGLANGYGYGEYLVQKYLEAAQCSVIVNDFNLFSKRSKFSENNQRIADVMGKENYQRLQATLNRIYDFGIKVENPDLCVLTPTLSFAEAKRDKDRLRAQQVAFAIAIWELFRIPFKVYKLLPGQSVDVTRSIYRLELPVDCWSEPQEQIRQGDVTARYG